jgi:CopG antitoxin of type II toxin-antitoxin system
MKTKIPAFKSARAAAAFVDKTDLSHYDLSGAQTVRFEMKRKDKSVMGPFEIHRLLPRRRFND